MDAKNLYGGIGRLLTVTPARQIVKLVNNAERKSISENGDSPVVENGVVASVEQITSTNADETEKSPDLQIYEAQRGERLKAPL